MLLKLDGIYCKFKNYIYLLACTHCGIQCVVDSTTPLNLRINIHRKQKSECEVSIDHYKNVCKNATFSIQVIGKLPGNVCKKGKKDNAMLEYQLQREDYSMKTLRTVNPYDLNKKNKSINKDNLY